MGMSLTGLRSALDVPELNSLSADINELRYQNGKFILGKAGIFVKTGTWCNIAGNIESGDTDDTPVIKVWATTLLAPPLWLHRNLKESAGAGNRPEQFQILRENTVGKIVIFVNHQAEWLFGRGLLISIKEGPDKAGRSFHFCFCRLKDKIMITACKVCYPTFNCNNKTSHQGIFRIPDTPKMSKSVTR